CHGLGMEKSARADIRPIERGGEQEIEIEQGKRRNQEIGLVGAPELHRFDPLALQQKDPGQNHSQDDDREGSKIFWHRRRRRSRGDGENNSTLRDNGGSSHYSDAVLLRVPSTRSVDHVSAWPRASLTLFLPFAGGIRCGGTGPQCSTQKGSPMS